MKIYVTSDIHLEFGDCDFENKDNVDVLILSGDILIANEVNDKDLHELAGENTRSKRYHDFMERCCTRFPHVIYILGNHEHYHGVFPESVPRLKEKFAYLKNLYILDSEIKTIDGITFIGDTLWTDMNNEDPITLYHMQSMMNDFRQVWITPWERRFMPEDAVAEHRNFLGYIQQIIEGKFDEKFVVVGHHAPSKLSTKPKYQADHIMNGGYSTDLHNFIIDHPQIKLWTHGHTHDDFDYMVGSTRIVCNPRGYINYEERADNWTPKLIELE